MAGTGRIIASIYRIGNYDFPGNVGRLNNLPGALTHFYPAPAGTTVNGVTMQTIIELLPSGLQTPGVPNRRMYAAEDVAAIQTAST